MVPFFGDLAWCIFAWMLVLILDDCLHASMKLHAMKFNARRSQNDPKSMSLGQVSSTINVIALASLL